MRSRAAPVQQQQQQLEQAEQQEDQELIKYSQQPDAGLYISSGHSHRTLLEIDSRFFIQDTQVLSPVGGRPPKRFSFFLCRRVDELVDIPMNISSTTYVKGIFYFLGGAQLWLADRERQWEVFTSSG